MRYAILASLGYVDNHSHACRQVRGHGLLIAPADLGLLVQLYVDISFCRLDGERVAGCGNHGAGHMVEASVREYRSGRRDREQTANGDDVPFVGHWFLLLEISLLPLLLSCRRGLLD